MRLTLGLFFLLASTPLLGLELEQKLTTYFSFNPNANHFSRTRFTLRSGASQSLGEQFLVRVSAQAFVDPAVADSADYPQNVKRDERSDFLMRDLYLDYVHLPFQLRLGRQEVVWGEALHYFSADLLHPKDFRDFFLLDLSESRIPQQGIWASYDRFDWSLAFVYFPYSERHTVPKFGAEFYLPIYGADSFGISNVGYEKKRDFSEPTVGFNFGYRPGAFDLHFIGVYQRDPQFHYDPTDNVYRFDQVWVGAVTGSYVYESWVFRAESTLYSNRKLNSFDVQSSQLNSYKSPESLHLFAVEWDWTPRVNFSTQSFLNQRYSCNSESVLSCSTFQQSVEVRWRDFFNKFDFETSSWIEPKETSVWWSTSLSRELGPYLEAQIRSDLFMGDGDSLYALLADRDQLSFKLSAQW